MDLPNFQTGKPLGSHADDTGATGVIAVSSATGATSATDVTDVAGMTGMTGMTSSVSATDAAGMTSSASMTSDTINAGCGRASSERRGMLGIAMAISIMGVLMVTSYAMSLLVRSEATIQSASDTSDRAADAAFSGTQYVASFFLGEQQSAFATTPEEAVHRLYFTLTPADVSPLWGSIKDDRPAGSAKNLVQAGWVFVDKKLQYLDSEETDDNEEEYCFRAVSFPKNNGENLIDPEFYMIKSQGKFRRKGGGQDMQQESRCQIIAEAKITVTETRRAFKINRWRRMEYQNDEKFNACSEY